MKISRWKFSDGKTRENSVYSRIKWTNYPCQSLAFEGKRGIHFVLPLCFDALLLLWRERAIKNMSCVCVWSRQPSKRRGESTDIHRAYLFYSHNSYIFWGNAVRFVNCYVPKVLERLNWFWSKCNQFQVLRNF